MRRDVNVLIFLDVQKALEGTVEHSFLFNYGITISEWNIICVWLKHDFRWNEALHFGQSGHSDWRFRWGGADEILPKNWVMAEPTTCSILSLDQMVRDQEFLEKMNCVLI